MLREADNFSNQRYTNSTCRNPLTYQSQKSYTPNFNPAITTITSLNNQHANEPQIIDIILNNYSIPALLDTGAAYSILSDKLIHFLNVQNKMKLTFGPKLQKANGILLPIKGQITLTFEVNKKIFTQKFLVTTNLVNNIVLGNDFLKANNVTISYQDGNCFTKFGEKEEFKNNMTKPKESTKEAVNISYNDESTDIEPEFNYNKNNETKRDQIQDDNATSSTETNIGFS